MRKFERKEEDKISSILLSVKYEDRPTLLRSLATLLRDAKNPLVIIDSVEAIHEALRSASY